MCARPRIPHRRLLLTAIVLSVVFGGAVQAAEERRPLGRLFSAIGDFPLGERTDRIDYESLDPTTGKLFIAKMGAGTLVVFDTVQNRVVQELPGFPKATGTLAVPQLHRLYVSVPGAGLLPSIAVGLGMVGLSSGRGALAVLDTVDMHELARMPGGVFPDGITFDPRRSRVFVSDEFGGAVLAYDAAANQPLARIDTHGEVGNTRYDLVTDKIYAPIQSKNRMAVIDPATLRLLDSIPLPGGRHPHGLLIAPGAAIAYVACDGDDRLLTVDLVSGKVLSVLPVAHDPDVLAVDDGLKRLYVAAESGVLETYDISKPTSPVSLGDVFIGEGAHTLAVDQVSHRLFLGLADIGGKAIMRVLVPKP